MKSNKNIGAYALLEERGMVAQCTDEQELRNLLSEKSVPFYIGFDPTADSLHVGHLVALRAAAIMQRSGHRPVIVVGGGTGMVGDPSGRTSMRPLLDAVSVNAHVTRMRKQMERFLEFDGQNAAVIVNNADWLSELKWIDTLREVGLHMSVNRMLATDAYKTRWERGLSFLELSYMVMQAYDFWHLFKTQGVCLQLGGSDQWANVLAGTDLIRRKEGKPAFGLTLTLLTKADGTKMGKTAGGALWLDGKKTSPYDFYQYWINVDDADVKKLLLALTDLNIDEIGEMTAVLGPSIARAKRALAKEVTIAVHGEAAANAAEMQSLAAFGGNGGEMPQKMVNLRDDTVVGALISVGFSASKGEARRLIEGGGVVLDGQKIVAIDAKIPAEALKKGSFTLFKGKKQRLLVRIKN